MGDLMQSTSALFALFVTALMSQLALAQATPNLESRYIRESRNNTKVIVFVHGVIGNSTTTWTHSQTKAYWPAMIAGDSDFGNANVYVFSYPSPPVGKSLSVNELAEAMRRRLQADKVTNHPEMIFLSHSMGGLVTRAFLVKYREHAAKVKMAYFLSTPTEGSPSALLASLASRNAQFRSMYPMQSDNYLADLQRDWLAARLGIRSFCAYEGATTYGIQIVDQRSASNLCTEPLDPITEDHIQIAKPANVNADAYIAFKNAFQAVQDGGVIPNTSASSMRPASTGETTQSFGGVGALYNGCSDGKTVSLLVCIGPAARQGKVTFRLQPGETKQLEIIQWSTYRYNCDGPVEQSCLPDSWIPLVQVRQ